MTHAEFLERIASIVRYADEEGALAEDLERKAPGVAQGFLHPKALDALALIGATGAAEGVVQRHQIVNFNRHVHPVAAKEIQHQDPLARLARDQRRLLVKEALAEDLERKAPGVAQGFLRPKALDTLALIRAAGAAEGGVQLHQIVNFNRHVHPVAAKEIQHQDPLARLARDQRRLLVKEALGPWALGAIGGGLGATQELNGANPSPLGVAGHAALGVGAGLALNKGLQMAKPALAPVKNVAQGIVGRAVGAFKRDVAPAVEDAGETLAAETDDWRTPPSVQAARQRVDSSYDEGFHAGMIAGARRAHGEKPPAPPAPRGGVARPHSRTMARVDTAYDRGYTHGVETADPKVASVVLRALERLGKDQ